MFEEELLEKTAVCTEILQDARNELYLNMRFLDVALNSLSLQPTFEVSDYAVDGAVFYYEIPHLIEQYKIGNVMDEPCISAQCGSTACLPMSLRKNGKRKCFGI